MYNDVPIDKLLDKTGSVFKLVILAARRAIELGDGAANLIDAPASAKVTTVALEEIEEGKITMKTKDEK